MSLSAHLPVMRGAEALVLLRVVADPEQWIEQPLAAWARHTGLSIDRCRLALQALERRGLVRIDRPRGGMIVVQSSIGVIAPPPHIPIPLSVSPTPPPTHAGGLSRDAGRPEMRGDEDASVHLVCGAGGSADPGRVRSVRPRPGPRATRARPRARPGPRRDPAAARPQPRPRNTTPGPGSHPKPRPRPRPQR